MKQVTVHLPIYSSPIIHPGDSNVSLEYSATEADLLEQIQNLISGLKILDVNYTEQLSKIIDKKIEEIYGCELFD